MLQVGIIGQETGNATFSHITSIDLANHVSFETVECSSQQEYESAVAKKQGPLHDQCFESIESIPPWRLAVLTPKSSQGSSFTPEDADDIFLSFHHTLFDGTAGRHFHEALLESINLNLNLESSSAISTILSFPTPPKMPNAEEIAVPFTLSPIFILRTLWMEFAPAFLKATPQPIWQSKPISLSEPYVTRILPVDVSATTLQKILPACRTNKTTLTGLLHALILASLAKNLPSAPGFAATTPISMRPYANDGEPETTMRVMVSTATHKFPHSIVSAFNSAVSDAKIWQTAQDIKKELVKKTTRLPKDDIVPMTKYITDWDDFWNKKDGQNRPASWEVSNIGVLEPKKQTTGDKSQTTITRIMFTNAAMVAGAPIGYAVASVGNGKLTIGITWQDTIIDEDLIKTLARDLEGYLEEFATSGCFLVPVAADDKAAV